MNYVIHMNKTLELYFIDERMTPGHIVLYLTLFHLWNKKRFINPLSISRRELMEISRIRSIASYNKYMKQLSEWDYIKYKPNKNPITASKVYMSNFNTSNPLLTCSEFEHDLEHDLEHPLYINNKNIKTKRESGKTPTQDQVIDYFISKKSNELEAKKFFTYYEANGWLLGGKSPIKNWEASIESWLLKTNQFNTGKNNTTILTTKNDNEYYEQL